MPMDRIRDWLRENRITEVECLVPDMTGNARGKFIPADKFIKEDSRLPESILVQTVTGDYTDIHDELVGPTDRDMMLQPDPDTMRLVPWAADPTGQIIHDCYTREGDLHPLASRNVLKRVLKLYEAEGWKPIVAAPGGAKRAASPTASTRSMNSSPSSRRCMTSARRRNWTWTR